MVPLPFDDRHGLLDAVPLPDLALLRQRFPRPRLADLEGAIAAALAGLPIPTDGARIAIAVGSRGVAEIERIVRATVAALRLLGATPLIVPAMGSHGGATAEGQRAVLASLGIDERRVGAPVLSSLEVDQLGTLECGLPVYIDRLARGCDGILAINRVKPHTDFSAPIESGLAKMVAIGLGKHAGALAIHSWGVEGMARHIPEAACYAVARAPIVGGLAVIENAFDELAEIVALPAAEIGREGERALLLRARALMARLPWDHLDVLVIDRMGKNISGAGMDTNITGRLRIVTEPKATAARITNIAVLDLTEESHGNAVGLGAADFTTARLAAKLDLQAMYINALTAGVTAVDACKIPMLLPTDRQAVAAAIRMCGRPDLARVRLARVPSTLRLEYILASRAALTELRPGSEVEVLGVPRPFAPRADGSLAPFVDACAASLEQREGPL